MNYQELNNKMLDQWYFEINKVYLESNFYRDVDSIFLHLIELYGLLSPDQKTDLAVHTLPYLAKSLGWWMTLCGKVGISSIQSMLWLKFPGVCPYCLKEEHRHDECKTERASIINWTRLHEISKSNVKSKPYTLAEWQKMFYEIYIPFDGILSFQEIYRRLGKELAELAEAIRYLPVNHLYFMSEAADVFAWIMRYLNQIDIERELVDRDKVGAKISEVLSTEYPGTCKRCGLSSCKCAPVPSEDLRRLTRDLPEETFSEVGLKSLLSFSEAKTLFEAADNLLVISKEEITQHEFRELLNVVTQHFSNSDKLGAEVKTLVEDIEEILLRQRVTQQNVYEILQEMSSLPGPVQTTVRDVLVGVGANFLSQAALNELLRFLGM